MKAVCVVIGESWNKKLNKKKKNLTDTRELWITIINTSLTTRWPSCVLLQLCLERECKKATPLFWDKKKKIIKHQTSQDQLARAFVNYTVKIITTDVTKLENITKVELEKKNIYSTKLERSWWITQNIKINNLFITIIILSLFKFVKLQSSSSSSLWDSWLLRSLFTIFNTRSWAITIQKYFIIICQ